MKKVLFSMAFAALLLSSCGSDENIPISSETGELKTTIKFDGLTQKASSAAIPITRWSNVNKLQLFLYDSNGKVAFSDIVDPSTAATSGTDKTFTWLNIPEGTYSLALVANIKSNEDPNVRTSLDGGANWTSFTGANVVNKILNTDLLIDLKELTSFPAGHTTINPSKKPYAVAPEIFTAYSSANVVITKGHTATLGSNLELKREISLMRVRIDREKKKDAPQLDLVKFDHASNFIAIENNPIGIGVKASTFAGGISVTPSDKNRVIVGASGTDTYKDTNPAAADYAPTDILGAPFTLWQDIRVLPNATKAENIAPDKNAPADRRYKIVIVGWVEAGYVFANGDIAQSAQPVYWSGTILGVFSPNIIREVNMTINTPGLPTYPEIPEVGGLEIVVGAPENWNSNIETENIGV